MVRKLLLAVLLVAPLGFYPLLCDTEKPDIKDCHKTPPDPLTKDQRLALGCFAILPGQSFPGALPWEAMRDLGQQETKMLEDLAAKNPLAFLEHCLSHSNKDIHGYRCIFDKQEKVNGKLRPKESIRVHFRQEPFSVHMDWLKGAGKAVKSLYVAGENDDLLIIRVFFIYGPIFRKPVDDDEVKSTSRFPVTRFGMYMGAKDTVEYMRKADKKGMFFRMLRVSYQGIVRPKELDERPCYKFVRWPYVLQEGLKGENLNELTIYIDKVTLMQIGSVLRDTEGKLIAEYFFREIVPNPTFDEKQFTPKSL